MDHLKSNEELRAMIDDHLDYYFVNYHLANLIVNLPQSEVEYNGPSRLSLNEIVAETIQTHPEWESMVITITRRSDP